jgi:anti-sigma regulatory factor (Ser/Thr protein kinase)
VTTTVYLPRRFETDAIYKFLNFLVDERGSPIDDHIVFDFRYLDFINGTGFTALFNTIEWLGNRGVRRQFARPPGMSPAISYLDDCGFFRMFLGKSLSETAGARPTTLPCTKIRHAEGHAWLEYTLSPWLSGVLGVPSAAIASVKTCMKEIFNNIADHSTEQIGCVHAQHYPQLRQVRLTVSDFGRGIPDTIKTVHAGLDDAQAILTASREGVTARSNPQNRGVGLDYLITHVMANHGKVAIYSHSGSLMCETGDANGDALRIPVLKSGLYPGTMVDIMLPTDRFVGDEMGTEDLEW